jgi:2,4-dienoyl-CoA reductase-like NADH-dependent reductase (Old Yellow Enzyme family)
MTLAGWARKLTGKPSMAVGGVGLNNWLQDTFNNRGETQAINNLDEVRRLFDAGMFDMIAVGRALISDPAWVEKARAGAPFLPFDKTCLTRLE